MLRHGGVMMHLENYVNTKYTEKMILNVFKVSGCNLNVAKINVLQLLTLNTISKLNVSIVQVYSFSSKYLSK